MQKVEIYVKSNTESLDVPFVALGNAVWSDKNFDGTTFRNGDSIPEYVGSDAGWDALTTPAWCYVDNDSANGDVYGKLYNFYAVSDPRGIAPKGWRVSTLDDWNSLASFASESIAALKTKSASLWDTAGDDSYGLAILPSAYRGSGGGFGNLDGTNGSYWTSTSHDSSDANAVSYDEGYDDIFFTTFSNSEGGAIRLVRNEGHTKLDLYDDEVIELTENIKDFKDVSKVLTDHTKQFSVPASTINNKVFKHYYNQDVVSGFDARFRVDVIIKLNGIDWKEGQIRLTGVDMKDGVAQAYKITFFGSIVSLNQILSDDTIDELPYLDGFNHSLSFSDTKDFFFYGANLSYDLDNFPNGLVKRTYPPTTINPLPISFPDMMYVFISAKDRYYVSSLDSQPDIDGTRNLYVPNASNEDKYHGLHYADLKPSIKAIHVIKAIEFKYGITFSDDFLNENSDLFRSVYLHCSGDSGRLTDLIEETEADFFFEDLFFSLGTEVRQGSDLSYFEITQNSSTGGNKKSTLLEYSGTVAVTGTGSYTFQMYDKETNKVYFEEDVSSGNYVFDISFRDPYGKVVRPAVKIKTLGGVNSVRLTNVKLKNTRKSSKSIDVVVAEANYITSLVPSLSNGVGFRKNLVPRMKCIDFLKSIFKAFNLVGYVENGEIIVKDLNSYYDEGDSYDISKYIDFSSSEITRSDIFSEINYEYQKPKTVFSIKYSELTSTEFGNERFISDEKSSFDGGKYDVKLKFGKMVYEKLYDVDTNEYAGSRWGYNATESLSPTVEPNLLHCIKIQPFYFEDNSSNVYDYSITDGVTWDSHPYPSNPLYPSPRNFFENKDIPSRTAINLNFGDEAYNNQEINENSLFKKYHEDYILSIYSETTRRVKIKSILPFALLLDIKMNDILIINNRSYRINSKKTNLQNLQTELELLSI